METKQCNKCKIFKLLTEFNKRSDSKDKLDYRCRDCAKIIKSKYYYENHEKLKCQHRIWAKTIRTKIKNNLSQTRISPQAPRKCALCKIEKSGHDFYLSSFNISGYSSHCKKCQNLINRERYEKDREAQKKRAKDYHNANREKLLAYFRNAIKTKERAKIQNKYEILFLSDNYLKSRFKFENGLHIVPNELIEVKRELVKLKRKVNENEKHGSTS